MTLKLVFTVSLVDAKHQRDSVANKMASLHVWSVGKNLAGFTHLTVVDRWPTTPKRARYSALIAFS